MLESISGDKAMKEYDDIRPTKPSILEIFNEQKANRYKVSMSTCEERKAKLNKLYDVIFAHEQEIRDAFYKDFHKPAVEVNLSEIMTVAAEIKNNMRKLKKWMQPHKVPATKITLGTKSFISMRPRACVSSSRRGIILSSLR
jgi:aldehyde dehydrogenase (NAD+)